MSTVSHLSQALQWVLDEYPRKVERGTGFVQRSSARLDGPATWNEPNERECMAGTRSNFEPTARMRKGMQACQVGHPLVRSSKPERIEVELYAKLISLLVVHWHTLMGCWGRVERSLRKAHQVCQWSSFGLALALQGEIACERIIEIIMQTMQKGCRVDARQKKPSTYQLIQNPILISP